MRKISRFLYIHILKPILFLFPADDMHDFFLRMGNKLGKYSFAKKFFRKIWFYENEILEQNICGFNFKNPLGLSAGFDYDADLMEFLPSIGFGFHSVGTLTHEPYAGNPAPMLGRLPKSRSLLVNKGFKNKGIKNALENLGRQFARRDGFHQHLCRAPLDAVRRVDWEVPPTGSRPSSRGTVSPSRKFGEHVAAPAPSLLGGPCTCSPPTG